MAENPITRELIKVEASLSNDIDDTVDALLVGPNPAAYLVGDSYVLNLRDS